MYLATLALALLLDLTIGEPKGKIHPTVWFGKLISFFDSKHRRGKFDLIAGTISSLVVVLFALALSTIPSLLPQPLSLILAVYFLKSTFSIRSLEEHVRATIIPEVEVKRERVSLIVSRNTGQLSEEDLNSAAIESLAENLVDSVIAPIFYFLLFGLPGAMVYRAVNTLDAMIGYKSPVYIDFGKFAARFDDLLNFIPARMAVMLFLPLSRGVWRYYRMARFKLNGDKPISAMSAVLGVKLEKKGDYAFPGRGPRNEDILRALKVFRIVTAEWFGIAFLYLLLKYQIFTSTLLQP